MADLNKYHFSFPARPFSHSYNMHKVLPTSLTPLVARVESRTDIRRVIIEAWKQSRNYNRGRQLFGTRSVYRAWTESVLHQRVVTSLQMCTLLGRRVGPTHSLSPPTGASQTGRECGEQRYVPAAHHLQRLQGRQVRRAEGWYGSRVHI